MTNIKDPTWPIEPHTKAKHVILENYLKAWYPILGSSGKVLYLDGFAGPGIYSNGEPGSPIIALKTALEHTSQKNFEITFVFIEKDSKRAQKLNEVLKERFPNLPDTFRYYVYEKEFEPVVNEILDKIEQDKLNLVPTFAFIDPFGYTNAPMATIGHLMTSKYCEVLITFMSDFINRFSNTRKEKLDELFGDADWQKEIIHEPKARKDFFLKQYETKLRKNANVKYTRSFEMVRQDGHTEYYLVFGTNHPKGMEAMKNAMYKVDKKGTYRFSDRSDPNQTYLTDVTDELAASQAAKCVFEKFKGQKVPASAIKNFVWAKTRFRFNKDILKNLEERQPPKIKVTGRKKSGFNYPDGCMVEFV